MIPAGANISDARNLMARVFDMPPASIPEDVQIGALEAWDSLGHLRLMLAIETALGRELDASETVKVECLADIANLLASRS